MSDYTTPPAPAGQASPAAPPEDMESLAMELCDHWYEAREWFEPAKLKAKVAREYYDGDPWDEQEKRELQAKGRPATSINRIFKSINNLSGKQRDARLSYKAYPRNQADLLTAAIVTRGLEHIVDANHFPYTESEAFMDAAKGPWGWAEVGHDDSDPTKEEVFVGLVPWGEILRDPYGMRKDQQDWRYLIRLREVDLDAAKAGIPGKDSELEAAIVAATPEEREQILADYNNRDDGKAHWGSEGYLRTGKKRPRVVLREHHYWKDEPTTYLKLANGERLDYDPTLPMEAQPLEVQQAVMMGAEAKQGKRRCFYVAVMAGKSILSHAKSDHPFQRFPYVMLPAFADSKGRPYGIIEQQIWAQKEYNVARSKLNEAIRSRMLIYQDEGLGRTSEQEVANKLSQANFVLRVQDINKIRLESDKTDVAMWLQMMATAAQEIDDIVGQNEAAYGDKSNEKSGVAIQQRVAQQSQNMGELFDNWRFFRLQVGEMLLALAIKHWSPEKWAQVAETRILQEHQDTLVRAAQMAASTGQPMPDLPQANLSWVGRAAAGISSLLQFHLKLEDQAETTTERQAVLQQMIDLMGLLPDQAKGAVAPDLIRMSDSPGAEEMASKAEAAMAPPPMPGAPPGMLGPMGPPPGPPPGVPGMEQPAPPPPPGPAPGGLSLPPGMGG